MQKISADEKELWLNETVTFDFSKPRKEITEEQKKVMFGKLYEDDVCRFVLENDLICLIILIAYNITKREDEHQAEEFVELKNTIRQNLWAIDFAENETFEKTGNLLVDLTNNFTEANYKIRKQRAYFFTQLLNIIEFDLHNIYSRENKKTAKQIATPLRKTIWFNSHFVILFELLRSMDIIEADKKDVAILFANFAGASEGEMEKAFVKTYLKKGNKKNENKNLLKVREDLVKMLDKIDTYLIKG